MVKKIEIDHEVIDVDNIGKETKQGKSVYMEIDIEHPAKMKSKMTVIRLNGECVMNLEQTME